MRVFATVAVGLFVTSCTMGATNELPGVVTNAAHVLGLHPPVSVKHAVRYLINGGDAHVVLVDATGNTVTVRCHGPDVDDRTRAAKTLMLWWLMEKHSGQSDLDSVRRAYADKKRDDETWFDCLNRESGIQLSTSITSRFVPPPPETKDAPTKH